MNRCLAQTRVLPLNRFAGLVSLALVGLAVYGSQVAQAAPVHPFLEASSLDGSTTPSGEFDKACGVAVDSKGDLYVANSANGSIDVFAPAGAYLTSIADVNGPCGLATDSKGDVFAVDTTNGNVVMFAPTAGTYPPTPGLTYAAAVTIDSSGAAKAVAVNPANDHVFVNRGTEILEYKSVAEGSGVDKTEIGKGTLVQGFGVDVYDATGNVYAADESGEVYIFNPAGTEVLTTIDGSGSPGGAFGALPEANIAVNQANGHVLIDDIKEGAAVDEFEANGSYLSTIEADPPFEDAGPSDLAVDPTEGTATAGRVYVSSGPGADAEVLAFGPLPTPSHPRLPELDPKGAETKAKKFQNPCGTAVDDQGNVYVTSAGTSAIDIFRPEGKSLKYVTSIADSKEPCGVAVDSKGNVYVAHPTAFTDGGFVSKYVPNKFPFEGTPTYSAPTTIDPGSEFGGYGIAVNPSNDHLLVTHKNAIFEYDSAANGSTLLRSDIGAGLLFEASGAGICASSGNVYVISNELFAQGIYVIDPVTNKAVTVIDGTNAASKKPDGGFGGSLGRSQIAVDHVDCHVYLSLQAGDVYEFEETGAYVSRFNRTGSKGPIGGIAVDNSGGPNARDIFVMGGYTSPATAEAFKGPAQYGTPPEVVTGDVTGANGSEATLQGTVNPGGVELSDCRFEYVDQATFEGSGFATATKAACVPGAAEIGEGEDPVALSAQIGALSPSLRYRYRLCAVNSFGTTCGNPRLFGPPAITTVDPSQILYTEATLDAELDPSGLETTYFFEYGPTDAYGSSTAGGKASGEVPTTVQGDVFELQQNTTYHFRLVATNSIATVKGPDQTFTTLQETSIPPCPNEGLRTGPSASLPDCRAYELVGPPDAGGRTLGDLRAGQSNFLAPMASPDGEGLLFYTEGALPGTDGNGVKDAYEARRSSSGWSSTILSPNGAQAVSPTAGGVSADHRYAFWASGGLGSGLDVGGESANYLRTPGGGYELIGSGESQDDPRARGHWISPDGSKLILASDVPLTADAPPTGTEALYERAPGGLAQLVSLKPGGVTPGAGEQATYEGASADGSAIAFSIGSTLYLRRGGQTLTVISGDFAFGGLSADGSRLFYVELPSASAPTAIKRGEIFLYDTATETSTAVGSGGESVLVNVSADGTHAYFASRQQLDGANGVLGAENLYGWDGSTVHFVGTLDSDDIESSVDHAAQRLGAWVQAVDPLGALATVPSRTNPNGAAFVFESLAPLSSFDNEGQPEIYRWDADAVELQCVSCPLGQPAGPGATLQTRRFDVRDAPANDTTKIANVPDDGASVFFETAVGLVPQDQNGALDVYEWRGGTVSLISPGTGEDPSYLYGVSRDGRDVFIATSVTLTEADVDNGARSIYDAREGGGFAAPQVKLPCQGEECKGPLNPPPGLAVPASPGLHGEGNVSAPRRPKCPKGKRAVKRGGKVRCVKKQKKRRGKRDTGARQGGAR